MSSVCMRHTYGELPANFGGLDGAGDDVDLPIDRLDYAGHAGSILEEVGDDFTGWATPAQHLAKPPNCSGRADLRACRGPF